MGCHGWTPQVVTGLGNTALLEEGGCEKEGGGPGFVPEPLSESHRINTTRAKIFFVHLQAVQLRYTPQCSLRAALLIV